MNYNNNQIIYISRAHPEPVEGFLRALEDILQQVQNEREEKKHLTHYYQ